MANLITLVSFNVTDGAGPFGSLIADASGDTFGTTSGGGANSDGTVFETAKTASGYASTPTTLVSFNGTDGLNPAGSLIADASGDLFGTTLNGGANGAGTVSEVTGSGIQGPGPSITLLPFAPGSGNQRVTIATATPALPTDTLSLAVVTAPSSGTVALTGTSVQFTPSSSNLVTPVTVPPFSSETSAVQVPASNIVFRSSILSLCR